MLSSLIVAASLLLTWDAAPVAGAAIECTTIASGYLYTDQTTYVDFFQLYQSNGTLAIDNVDPGFDIFVAEFQACTPNYLGYANDGTTLDDTYAGHLLITSSSTFSGLCLSVQDPFSPPPYEVTAAACGSNDDKEQVLVNWVMTNQKIFYGGKTKADGSTFQGGKHCAGSGLYGYQGDSQGLPTTYGSPTPLVCATGEDVHGFILVAA